MKHICNNPPFKNFGTFFYVQGMLYTEEFGSWEEGGEGIQTVQSSFTCVHWSAVGQCVVGLRFFFLFFICGVELRVLVRWIKVLFFLCVCVLWDPWIVQ